MIPTSRPQISLLLPLENTIAAIYEILLLPLSVVSKTSATIIFSSLKGRDFRRPLVLHPSSPQSSRCKTHRLGKYQGSGMKYIGGYDLEGLNFP